jgi:hypothetical protein
VLRNSSFAKTSFVGASLTNARISASDFKEADFWWAEVDSTAFFGSETGGTRWPEIERVAHRPAGTSVPGDNAIPLYRIAATDQELAVMLNASGTAATAS